MRNSEFILTGVAGPNWRYGGYELQVRSMMVSDVVQQLTLLVAPTQCDTAR